MVLKHIDASAMMDLLLRLISCVEPAPLRQDVLHVSWQIMLPPLKITNLKVLKLFSFFFFSPQWLNEEKLVQRLAELIHTGKDEEVSVH